MHIKALIPLLLCLHGVLCAQKMSPPELVEIKMHDESEIVKLAEEQKFLIPGSGNNINMKIEYIPKNSGQCTEIPQTITYSSLAQSPTIFNYEDQVVSMLPLIKRQIVFVADPYYNIASYSIDQHFLMKPRIPNSPLFQNNRKSDSNMVNPVMVTNQNEEYIIYLTNKRSFIFHYSNLASDIKEIEIPYQPQNIFKAILIRNYLILCGGEEGIMVYHVEFETFKLTSLQKIIEKGENVIDMQFNKNTQLLYALTYQSKVLVYSFNPDDNLPLDKRQALFKNDELSLEKIIFNHKQEQNPTYEPIGNTNIEISLNRQEQLILILFYHYDKTIVAELSYDSQAKKYFFVRYYKYAVVIKEIHVISNEVMLVVGDGILGMFPYGIDPRLIDEQFNGYMALTSVDEIHIVEPPFFVGINKNQIEYGGIFLNQETGIVCHLNQVSKLKQIKLSANLTTCGQQFPLRVSKYCSYQKTFIVRPMQMTASANVAASIWITTIIFTLLLVFGLCCIFAIHKKKQREIRKLQLYFEQRKRSAQIPGVSDRN